MSREVVIRIDRDRMRGIMVALGMRLTALGVDVRWAFVDGPALPSTVAALFSLERLVFGKQVTARSETVKPDPATFPPPSGAMPFVTIDLATRASPVEGPWLRVINDGNGGEDAVLAAALARRSAVTEIIDGATGVVLERGIASMENASGVLGGLLSIYARVNTLVVAQVAARSAGIERPAPIGVSTAAPRHARSAPYVASHLLAMTAANTIYRLCCHAPHWRIGWRLHDGPGVMDTQDLSGPSFKVLASAPGHFYADPFPMTWQGRTAILMEDLDHRTGKGVIAAVPFDEAGPSGPARPVLETSHHLSYPFMIEHDGELYMIPETSSADTVELYRCVEFPDRWQHHTTLISGAAIGDATVIPFGGRWWLAGSLYDGFGGWSDTLVWYSSDSLFGPWRPHRHNPVFVDRGSARPAGPMVVRDGQLWRPVQDCTTSYGSALALAEVTRLDDDYVTQVVRCTIRPGPRWPGRKLHTLSRHGRLETIDGSVIRPKWNALADLVEHRTQPVA